MANPTAGRGRGRRWLEKASGRLERAGVEVRSVLTAQPGDGERAVREASSGLDGVWGIGGDGTLNELIQGLGGQPVPLGILPVGTGNVVARALGVSRSFERAFERALHGEARRVDLGRVNGRRFLFAASAGFDGAVVHQIARQRSGTMSILQYLPALLACRRLSEPRFRIEVDGEPLGGVCWAAALNVGRYGSGLMLAPQARVDDGMLDLVLLRDPVQSRLFRVLWHALRGRLEALPDARILAFRRARFEGIPKAQVDGDPLLAETLEIEVEPGALWFRG